MQHPNLEIVRWDCHTKSVRKLHRIRIFFAATFGIFGLLATTAPTNAIDLGPSSDYLIRVAPEAKAVIEKAVTASGGKVNQK